MKNQKLVFMTKIKFILFIVAPLALISCKTEKHSFQLDKRYWDTDDYEEAITELRFGYETDEQLPTFNDPETKMIVQKLTDHQNYKVVLDDDELGLNHRNTIAEQFFDKWKDMNRIYDATDRKDKYLYEKEMIAVWQFGLGLQLRYFKLGIDKIKENADDPNSSDIKSTINSNVSILIDNYMIYLDEINKEKAYTSEGNAEYAKGIETYFSKLIHLYPEANYSSLEKKITLMSKKSNSQKTKDALKKISDLITSKKTKENQ